ncbi:FtsK/SpoIIIE domain-containing protein [Nonomuraea sp. GTA35]|uniref:FtsK/SpoIIIE domain-containing protein n=1 Tax=Nonomuraea sp. GTA35 TaxID=1676746 RepID=UPI0035BF8A8C
MNADKRPDLRLVPPRHGEDAPDLPLSEDEEHKELALQHGGEVESAVVEGEIVSDKPGSSSRTSMVVDRITVLRPHAGKAVVVARHSVIVLQGLHSWWVRATDGLTFGIYREQIRAARARGDADALDHWLTRRREAARDRRERLLELPKVGLQVLIFAGGGCLAVVVLMVIVSTLVLMTGAGGFQDVFLWVGGVLKWLFGAIRLLWAPLLVAGLIALIVTLHREGRRTGTTPSWLSDEPERSVKGGRNSNTPVLITPSVVVTAMRDLGIAPLKQAIKQMPDHGAGMLGLIRIAGCGVEVDVTLPSGVSTDKVQGRRRTLAENLGRHEHEVFITIPKKARTVRLWIADPGALDEPIGPSPLVTDKEVAADYKKGRAPWGQNLRGQAVGISLHQRMLLITGLSNQGKTAALRALALWLAFDIRVRFRIADLKGFGDWGMFDGLAEVLIEGPTDEHVIEATEMLEWGVDEMERRLQAPAGTKFDPVILIVDEAQVAFMCPAREEYITDDGKVKQGAPYGGSKSTSRYFLAARKIHNQGRAVDVILWQGTQNPTDQNLPVLVREGAHVRASLVVGTESQSRMALGDKAVDGGAAPHLLRQGIDKGTVVVAGDGVELPPGQSSITIRTHFVSDPEAVEVADRAKAFRRGDVQTRSSMDSGEQTDPCIDIAAVLGSKPRMYTQEVLQRLAERDPARYREWTFADLTQFLEGVDAAPSKSHGRMVVSREKVLKAVTKHAESHPEEDDKGEDE